MNNLLDRLLFKNEMKLTSFLLCSATVAAIEVELDLQIQPTSAATATYVVAPFIPVVVDLNTIPGSFTTQVNYSGNLLASAEVNSNDGTIESIEFSGGTISTQNISTTQTIPVASFQITVNFSTAGITRTIESTEVDVLTDSFLDGNLHFTSLTGGIIVVNNFNFDLDGVFEAETVNLTTETSDLIAGESILPDFTNISSIGTTLVNESLLENTFSVAFSTSIQVPSFTPDATIQTAGFPVGQELEQRYSEFGFLTAQGSFSIPSAFAQWALDQGVTLVTGDEVNEAGFPFDLLFALGLDVDATSLPLTFEAGSPVIASIELPEDGLRFPLGVEFSPDLTSDFTELGIEQLPDGPNSVVVGRTGITPIAFPAGNRGFIRFFANR